MPDRQIALIPVSPQEFTSAAYHLAMLLQQVEEEEDAWKEAKEAHKETMTVLKKGIGEQRALIRRAQLEAEEGLMGAPIQALLNQHDETHEGE